MFSTCLHCQKKLGTNDAIEHFPVGRRVAFDGSQGRLWAVCRHCQRWNLAPFDSRWEAVEECERAFRSTRIRVSTDQIGLARLPDGTDLVRIGAPQRPEFAAWRYGDQFGRRRRKAIVTGIGVTAAIGVGAAGFVSAGIGIVALSPLMHVLNLGVLASSGAMTRHRALPHPEGGYFAMIGPPQLVQRSDVDEGWGINVGVSARFDSIPNLRSSVRDHLKAANNNEISRLAVRGNEADVILRRVMPGINRGGASARVVQDGVRMIEQVGDPAQFGTWAATQRSAWAREQYFGDTGDLASIPPAARLAFEMALHEESERRALDGELAALEAAWRDAEEIAAIADGLLVPPAVDARLKELRSPDQGDRS